jgi:hypothetical protein
VAQSGSVSEWGSEGRWFKSTRPDQCKVKTAEQAVFLIVFISRADMEVDNQRGKIYKYTGLSCARVAELVDALDLGSSG